MCDGGDGRRRGVFGEDVTDWRGVGRPQLDPSTRLRVSGAALGRGALRVRRGVKGIGGR